MVMGTTLTFRRKLLVFCLVLACNSTWANKCRDLFTRSESEVHAFEADFGKGVYVKKLSDGKFQVEPPLLVLNSVRATQLKLLEIAKAQNQEDLTFIVSRMTEREVVNFRLMLERDIKVDADSHLQSILLDTRMAEEAANYDTYRARAKQIQAKLLERFDWSAAKITKIAGPRENSKMEVYELTVPIANSPPAKFLLTLFLKASSFAKNRTSALLSVIGNRKSPLKDATPEEASRVLIRQMREADPGIQSGTFAVMSADFIIALNLSIAMQ
jgi:hypothetical protein